MKFRCKMIDVVAMRDFTSIVNVVSRMSKLCVLRVAPDNLCFTVSNDRVPVVWAEISQSHYFSEYIMNGVSEEQNEIYLEFDALMLTRSLLSLKSTAKCVKIKLTNKRQPCLTFEIELPSLSIEARHCVHDVPVRVIPRREWSEYQPPNIPEFDVSIDMPQLRLVRNIVDRMKNMSPRLTLMADKSGTLILKVDMDSATVSTHFQGTQGWESSQLGGDDMISATVDIKKFLAFLAWDTVHPESVKCNILADRIVSLFLNVAESLKIHYFIPTITI